MRRAPLLIAALVLVCQAAAHAASGPTPRIEFEAPGTGPIRTLTVRLKDANGAPISGASVTATATMTTPHLMSTPPWHLHPAGRGVYKAQVFFAMLANWTVTVRASGRNVAPSSSKVAVDTFPPKQRVSKPALAPTKGGHIAAEVLAGGVALVLAGVLTLAWRRKRLPFSAGP
jgi:YtkA-like